MASKRRPRHAAQALGLLLGLALAACAGQPATTRKPSGGATPKPLGVKPSTSPSLGADPQASPATVLTASTKPGASPLVGSRLQLPGRLGWALPSALVGPLAQAHLTGADGQVALPGTELLALNDGRIVSNNSGSLISDQGGNIISNNSGAIVSNNSGSLISDQGGNLAPGGRRLLAKAEVAEVLRDGVATAPVKNPITDPRMRLWLILALLDLDDQFLSAYLKSGPRLGEWKRFPAGSPKLLPMPLDLPLFQVSSEQFNRDMATWHFAGHLSVTGGQARLRLAFLPSAKAPLAEALPLLDLQSSGSEAIALTRFVPAQEAVFGFSNSAARARLHEGPFGRELEAVVAEAGSSSPGPTSLAALLNPGRTEYTRRFVRLRPLGDNKAEALLTSGARMLLDTGKTRQRRNFLSIGYAPQQREGGGLALIRRETNGLQDEAAPIWWDLPFGSTLTGDMPVWPFFLLAEGYYSQVAPPDVARLLPPYQPSDDALIPAAPALGEDPAADPALRPAPFSAELLAAPETP